jgi:hypothetical protein
MPHCSSNELVFNQHNAAFMVEDGAYEAYRAPQDQSQEGQTP